MAILLNVHCITVTEKKYSRSLTRFSNNVRLTDIVLLGVTVFGAVFLKSRGDMRSLAESAMLILDNCVFNGSEDDNTLLEEGEGREGCEGGWVGSVSCVGSGAL